MLMCPTLRSEAGHPILENQWFNEKRGIEVYFFHITMSIYSNPRANDRLNGKELKPFF